MQVHIGAIKCGNGCAAQELECPFHISPQDFQCACDTSLPGSSQAVSVSSADQHGVCSQADGLDDITAATNTAVHEHLGSAIHRGDNFRQHPQRSGNAVELATTMI